LRDRLRYASPGPVETGPELSDLSLAAALARLSDGDREALLLRYWEELAPDRVAEALGCSRGAASVRLHRARRRLARELNLQASDACAEASST
jgi:DNA-directed RNA polymerase specialized sigma24 family protein